MYFAVKLSLEFGSHSEITVLFMGKKTQFREIKLLAQITEVMVGKMKVRFSLSCQCGAAFPESPTGRRQSFSQTYYAI